MPGCRSSFISFSRCPNELVQHTPSDIRAEDGFPPVDCAHGLEDLGWPRFSLDQVSLRPFPERVEHPSLLTLVVQYDHPGVRKPFADLRHRPQVAGVGCAYLQEDDVRTCLKTHLAHQVDGLWPILGLAHDRDALCTFEQCARPLTEGIIAVHDCQKESGSRNRQILRQFFAGEHPIMFCDSAFQEPLSYLDDPLVGRSELVDWKPYHWNEVAQQSYGTETGYVLPILGRTGTRASRAWFHLYRLLRFRIYLNVATRLPSGLKTALRRLVGQS